MSSLFLQKKTRWWFQIFFYFHPYLGKISNLTNIFQMGWNHQLENSAFFQVILVALVRLAIVLSTAGIYLRSRELEFRIQELKVGWMLGWVGCWGGMIQNGIQVGVCEYQNVYECSRVCGVENTLFGETHVHLLSRMKRCGSKKKSVLKSCRENHSLRSLRAKSRTTLLNHICRQQLVGGKGILNPNLYSF